MSSQVDVAIIGAGPYGLSIAAHLRAKNIEHRVFGVPMDSWSNNMPPGMCLKSDAQASSLSDPDSSLTLEQYCRSKGIAYHPYRIPVTLDHFIAYGQAFQQSLVPYVEPARLLSLKPTISGATLEFDRGEVVNVRQAVIAVGVVPFKYIPADLARLPSGFFSHSGDYGRLEKLKGKEVAVVGAGSSALDLAALLASQGTRVTLVARRTRLKFQPKPLEGRESFPRRVLRRLLTPSSHGLGDGWLMKISSDAPGLIHALPDMIRLAIVTRTLGPSGGYFIRDRVEQDVTVKLGMAVTGADLDGGGLRLALASANGTRETLHVDHVIAATGYRVDLRKLNFLGPRTLGALRMVDHTPVLSTSFESSVPGIYFAGLTAARSFGPALRFVMGARHPAGRLAEKIPKSLSRRAFPVSVPTES